tara:strand:+ start:12890 stop:13438 length:549 start_codon:yes stop_codon:yes gene_type:complete
MIVFDTETTGLPLADSAPLSSQPKIIEIALMKLDEDMNVLESYERLVNPEIPIPKDATAVNGILDSDVENMPPFVGILNELSDFFIGQDKIFAHNVVFDMRMLVFELRRIGYEYKFPYPKNQICTVEMSKPLLSTDDAPRSLRLVDLYHHAFDKKHDKAHRAMDDVKALVEYMKWMKEKELI